MENNRYSKAVAALEIENRQAPIPKSVFLGPVLLPYMELKVSNTAHYWLSTNPIEYHLRQLYDIRLKFANEDAALAFYHEYVDHYSGYAPEIVQHHVQHTGANAFKVFTGDPFSDKISLRAGYRAYCYLFTVDNYFAKIYADCNSGYIPQTFQYLVAAAIRQLKLATRPPGWFEFKEN